MVSAAEYYQSQTQPLIHAPSNIPETTAVESQVHYVGVGMAMPPQIQHFEVTGPSDHIPRYHALPPHGVPHVEALAPMPFNGVYSLEKPMGSRILDQYSDRSINFEYLGLEG